MASLKEVKNRISSVKSTRQITSAMKMVASAKLHKAQGRITSMLPYQRKLNEILTNFLRTETSFESAYTARREVARVAIVVCSSNSSLCGAYNSNVAHLLEKTLADYSHLGQENILVYPVGKKVEEAVKKMACTKQGSYQKLVDVPAYADAYQLAGELMASFAEQRVDRVELIYHHFKSMGSQVLTREDYLPIDLGRMAEGAAGCDAAFFVGYHAMAGTEKAVLDHTFDSRTIYGLTVNGLKMGETGVNALFCGALGVPVAFVSGDDALCTEARSLLGPQLRLCSVKEGLGRGAALCRTPEDTEPEIYAAAKEAAGAVRRGEFSPFTLEGPYVLEISFMNTLQTDAAALVPGARRIAGRALRFESGDVFELRRFICTAAEAARAAQENY